MSQSQQQAQATYIHEDEIRMSINLPYVESASEKLHQTLRSNTIRSIFYNEKLWINYFVNQKIEQLQKIKTTSFMKLTIVTVKQVYLSESKWSFKPRSDKHERSVLNCDCKE